MSKIRKVYNLRKTNNIKQPTVPQQSRVSQYKQEIEQNPKPNQSIDKNLSVLSQPQRQNQSKIIQEPIVYQVQAQQLSINRLQLNFDVPLNDINKQQIKIKNIGNSAVYVQFKFKNHQKINNHAIKDNKIKFYCHYQQSVIKPAQQIPFIFSFLSEFPGNFTEEVQICCQPPLRTPIPNLKLNGRAYIQDQCHSKRQNFNHNLEDIVLKNQVQQILKDIVLNVKLPPPPLPDVKDTKVAQIQFQSKNKDLNLYFNEYLHKWFDELFNQICEKANIPQQDRYWNQSVQTLRIMIEQASYLDEIDKKCYKDRLEHYCYLSMTPLPNKSELYQTVYKFVSNTAYNIGGDFVDTVRKEMDMWEIPFRQPLETDTEQELKARKQQVDKIKAEWVKKAKKKKWGEEEQKEMVNQFKSKVQAKATEDLVNRFDNFEEGAEFIKTTQFIKKSTFRLEDYPRDLERVKTVREYALDGKKVLIKWHLKLKQNCQDKLKELQEYLTKKKQLQKRLEQQKKEGSKKKKAAKPKKKGQKEQEEEKPLFFDFMSILDQQNWNGLTETFRVVMEKQPFIIFIGITYGPRSGRHIPQYSVQFILEHLRTLQSAIEFLPHDQLDSLPQKIENQAIGQGSILLMENLNFLPYQVAQEQTVEPPTQQEKQPKIVKRKLLQPQIRQFFDKLGQSIDVLVNQDRYLSQLSGFTAYLGKEIVIGTQWWKYVGLSTRVIDSTIVFGQDFDSKSYLLLSRLAPVVREIILTGKIGAKLFIVKNNLTQIANIKVNQAEKGAIKGFLAQLQHCKLSEKIKIAKDFILKKKNQDQIETMTFDGSQENTQGYEVCDIGDNTIEQISQIQKGNFFVLGQTSIERNCNKLSESLSKLLRVFFKKQEAKKERHAHESSSPSGIDYTQDLVIYLIGLDEGVVQKVQLKEKKVKIAEEDQQQEQQQEEQGQNDKKKIEMVSDFRLSSLGGLYRLWKGEFDIGLKDISKYPMIIDV